MKTKIVLVILLLCVPLIAGACTNRAKEEIIPTGEWKVYYDTESAPSYAGIPQWGKAVAEGSEKVIGKATVEKLVSDEDDNLAGVLVRETHYDAQGNEIFSALSLFSYPDEERVEMTDVSGEMVVDLFPHWPMTSSGISGSGPPGGGMPGGGMPYGGY